MDRSHTLADRERTALALLASAMFAEAHELDTEGDLARCLSGYVTQLLHPRVRRRDDQGPDSYEVRDLADAPVFRRLATSMEALALGLGPWSGVGRALAGWAERITLALAVAEAEHRRATVHGPSDELLTMAAALAASGPSDPIAEAILAGHPELIETADVPDEQPAPAEPIPHKGRIWSRRDGDGGRLGRVRR